MRHGDVDDREQIAFAAAGLRQSAFSEPQLLSGPRARGDLEHDRTARRRQLHGRAEHRFPRRERQIDIQIVPCHTEQRMRLEHDVEIQIAIAAAIESLATLAGDAQPLAIGRALGNARFERALRAMDDAAVVVVGHDQIELHLRAVIGLFERDMRRDLVILAGERHVAPCAAAAESAGANR